MVEKTITLKFKELGNGTPMIFLHGYPLSHKIWLPLVVDLKKQARLILPDLRGHGESPVTNGTYSMSLMADDVVRLMDTLQITKAILLGHSMGGYVSLAFTKKYPDRLAGLGLVATQAIADTLEKKQGRLEAIQLLKSQGTQAIVESMLPRLTSRTELHDPLREIMSMTTPLGIEGALRGIAEREDSTSSLSGIRVPSMVIAGVGDKIVPLERAQEMTRWIPNSWLVKIEGAGHMPMMETPKQVIEACLTLLDTVEAKQSMK